jgi:[ribosomal protein S18]-alanine N-acetyltransferase
VKPLHIQPLTTELLPAALELDQRCLGGLWSREGYERELASPNSDLLVLRQGEQRREGENRCGLDSRMQEAALLGMGCLWSILEEAHITTLAVEPDYQRQGLGQALLYALIVSAWRRRLEWATLEVRVSNQTAIALYRKFGFQEVGRRRRYYQDNGEDALILWRSGLQKPDFCQVLPDLRQKVNDRLHQSGWHLIEILPELPLDVGTLS